MTIVSSESSDLFSSARSCDLDRDRSGLICYHTISRRVLSLHFSLSINGRLSDRRGCSSIMRSPSRGFNGGFGKSGLTLNVRKCDISASDQSLCSWQITLNRPSNAATIQSLVVRCFFVKIASSSYPKICLMLQLLVTISRRKFNAIVPCFISPLSEYESAHSLSRCPSLSPYSSTSSMSTFSCPWYPSHHLFYAFIYGLSSKALRAAQDLPCRGGPHIHIPLSSGRSTASVVSNLISYCVWYTCLKSLQLISPSCIACMGPFSAISLFSSARAYLDFATLSAFQLTFGLSPNSQGPLMRVSSFMQYYCAALFILTTSQCAVSHNFFTQLNRQALSKHVYIWTCIVPVSPRSNWPTVYTDLPCSWILCRMS